MHSAVVGQFDLHFTLGAVAFSITTPVRLFREGGLIASWHEGSWPEAGFREVLNVQVARCEVVSERRIVIEFASGVEMHLEDDSDLYEAMQVRSDERDETIVI